ncbi:neprilysin-2 isoform X1 [Culicoides brevitarsis]|uniref:neprilysin-2 isoform X1 n=1 Tax=Culicoides brevitarsis TaxID=469753 RepID=UPI00307B6CF9
MQTVIKNPSWWRRRTSLERTLTLISIVCLVAVFTLIITLIGVIVIERTSIKKLENIRNSAEALDGSQMKSVFDKSFSDTDKVKNNSKHYENICLTSGCVHSASNMLNQMNTNTEPCDDFYDFACGNFVRETIIPDEKVSVNTFSIIGDKLQEQLRTLVTDPILENDPEPFKLAKKLYKACYNKSNIEKRGTEPLIKIHKSLGGWPVIEGDDWDESKWSWTKSVKDFRARGYSADYILDFSVGTDLKNSSRRIIDIDQASIGISREYLIKGWNNTIVQAYYSYSVDMAVLFGADRNRAEKELKQSVEFEMSLANISLANEKRRNATALYNPMTLKEVQEKYNYVDWVQYINVLLEAIDIKVDDTEVIIVSVPSFFEGLGKLLKQTPKRTIANYVLWRITGFSSFFLTENLRKRQLQYSTVISGKQEQEPRWKECVDIVTGSLPISVGALYIRKHFKEESRQAAMDMVNNIKAEFEKILQRVDWMDENTRKSGLEKVKAMATHIGYPVELTQNDKLEEYYKSLAIDENEYLESVLKINIFGTNKAFQKLRKPVNKTEWISHARPAIVNAFYSSIENSIQFPAGILQGQFFSADRPKYMNYGAIGFVIGHEITHGFDDQGRQFDKDGNLVDWWNKATKSAYLEKAKCIIEQYGNYTEPSVKMNLNGINTQGENIADNGGIKEAYLAYKEWMVHNGPEPKLPGLNYTPEQMFWIAAAQTWCSVYRPETMKMRITTGVHSPGQFRVLGPMSNMEEFSKDFSCPLGSKMNPIHKCVVW